MRWARQHACIRSGTARTLGVRIGFGLIGRVWNRETLTMKSAEDSWLPLFQRIASDRDKERFRPTMKDTAAFEEEWGILFPLSYTTFIQVFGPGTLAQEFKFYAPGCGDSTWDLSALNNYYQKAIRRLAGNSEAVARPDFLSKVIWFATTFHGTAFGWS